jgi:hypothetical protein
VKSGQLKFDSYSPFPNFKEVNEISPKIYGKEEKREKKVPITPRKRKSQRFLRNIDKFMDTPHFHTNINILKFRNKKKDDMTIEDQILNLNL